MPLPALVPILGSIAGTLAGPGIGAGVASALGLGGTAAGSLIASAAPKAIGAGIASLAGGANVPEAVEQVMQKQPGVGEGQGTAATGSGMFTPPPATTNPAAYSPSTPLQSTPSPQQSMAMGMPPQQQPAGMPPQQPPMGMGAQQPMGVGAGNPTLSDILSPRPQPPAASPFGPQMQNQRQSLSTGLASVRPQQRPAMGSITRGIV